MIEADPHRNNILVVDDELAARRALIRILEQRGPYRCDGAASTLEARGLLEKKKYGLVITDMRMWGEEGIELVREIGDDFPDTATMMVSGQDDEKLEQKAIQSGASFFVRKPYKADDIVEKVEAALDKRAEDIKLRRHRDW